MSRKHIPPDYVWPDHVTPERTALWAGDPSLSRLDALRAALQGERRGYEFYYAVAGTSNDPDDRQRWRRSSSARRPST